MPWCPICKNEYRAGIKLCAECQVELVDHLEEEEERDDEIARQEKIARLHAMLAEGQEAGDGVKDESVVYHAYQNSAAKAEDNRTSAYTLLFVGILGFVLVVLVFMGVIPLFRGAETTRYFVCGVMGALFVLFIVFGVVSMRNSKILLVQAQAEDSLMSELTKWCGENMTAEQIDGGLFEEEMLDEQKYFKRTDRMKAIINDKFLNLDQGLLEHFVDEYYQGLFEANEDNGYYSR